MKDIDKAIKEAKAGMLPYESWEHLEGEPAPAFSAFCVYRDLKADRNIRKAVDSVENDSGVRVSRYSKWRKWAIQFRWKERAGDYDKYIECMKQAEVRKTIEAQGEKHREVTGKMLDVVSKKLDLMNPEDLTQGNLTEWVEVAIKSEREAAGIVSPTGKSETKQGEFKFVSDFQGL